jgi:hypothetical protein
LEQPCNPACDIARQNPSKTWRPGERSRLALARGDLELLKRQRADRGTGACDVGRGVEPERLRAYAGGGIHLPEKGHAMGLINWIFDIYQQYRIDKLQDEALQTRAQAARVRGDGGNVDPERLEQALGELALAVKTVQRIVVEKGLCSPEELRQALHAIDVEDGKADGRSPTR